MTKNKVAKKNKHKNNKNHICLEKIEDSYKKSRLLRKN